MVDVTPRVTAPNHMQHQPWQSTACQNRLSRPGLVPPPTQSTSLKHLRKSISCLDSSAVHRVTALRQVLPGQPCWFWSSRELLIRKGQGTGEASLRPGSCADGRFEGLTFKCVKMFAVSLGLRSEAFSLPWVLDTRWKGGAWRWAFSVAWPSVRECVCEYMRACVCQCV